MDPAHLAQVRRLPLVQGGRLGGRLIEQRAGLLAGEPFVGDLLEGRLLVGPDPVAAGRHHGLAIPVQHGERAADVGQTLEARLKRAIGGHGQDPRGSPAPARRRATSTATRARRSRRRRPDGAGPTTSAARARRPGRRARSRGPSRPARRRPAGAAPAPPRSLRNSARLARPVAAASSRWVRLRRTAGSPRSGSRAPSHSGQLAQASEAPLLVISAAPTMAPSASSQVTSARPPPTRGPGSAAAVRAKISHRTLNSSSAVPRWRATDQGLFWSSTVRPPSPAWTSSSRTSAAA